MVSLSRTAWYDALLRLLAACGMFLLAFALAQREAQARRLLYAILAIVTAYALLGLGQEIIGWRLTGSDAYRTNVVSTFVNRNHFATYANLGLIIALGLMIEPLLRGDATQQGRWTMRVAQAIGTVFEERRLPLMAAVVILLAVIGSASRGGILSLAGAVTFLMALVFLAGRAKRSTKVMASIATFGAGFLVVWLTGDVLLERFQVIFAAETVSEIDARIAAWAMTLDAIAQRPWLGYGHGAFLEVFYLHGGPELGAIGHLRSCAQRLPAARGRARPARGRRAGPGLPAALGAVPRRRLHYGSAARPTRWSRPPPVSSWHCTRSSISAS